MKLIFAVLLVCSSLLFAGEEDFVSNESFKRCADYVVYKAASPFDPTKVKKGDIIYVQGHFFHRFLSDHHPYIPNPYILITHYWDTSINGQFAFLLNDPKIIAWFAVNVDNYRHPKLFTIPLGVDVKHGKWKAIENVRNKTAKDKKKYLLYMNFTLNTCRYERGKVNQLFFNKPYCFKPEGKKLEPYLQDVAASKFVLSPRGAGLDTFRTWEALYMGSIPVVRTSSLDILFEGLPVLIIDNWEEIDEQFLNEKYAEFSKKAYNWEKLSPKYWNDMIQAVKLDNL